MNILRKHWFDIGGLLAIISALCITIQYKSLTTTQLILWLSLISLFIHQFEEYRYPGYFPGMINSTLYKSDMPDRYPLNTQTSLIVNVVMGWGTYFLAAVYANEFIWLGIATMLVSLGNVVAHTTLFNIKGKTLYNPGLATAIVLFLPLAIWFGEYVISNKLASPLDWVIGILLGLALNIIGILKLIDWLADKNTGFIFENRQLKPADRTKI